MDGIMGPLDLVTDSISWTETNIMELFQKDKLVSGGVKWADTFKS